MRIIDNYRYSVIPFLLIGLLLSGSIIFQLVPNASSLLYFHGNHRTCTTRDEWIWIGMTGLLVLVGQFHGWQQEASSQQPSTDTSCIIHTNRPSPWQRCCFPIASVRTIIHQYFLRSWNFLLPSEDDKTKQWYHFITWNVLCLVSAMIVKPPSSQQYHGSLRGNVVAWLTFVGGKAAWPALWNMAFLIFFIVRQHYVDGIHACKASSPPSSSLSSTTTSPRVTMVSHKGRVYLHIWAGHAILFWLLLHTALLSLSYAIQVEYSFPQWKQLMFPPPNNLYTEGVVNFMGWLGLLCYIVLWLTSLPWFRSHYYEGFAILHILLTGCFLLFSNLHDYNTLQFIQPALAVWLAERIHRQNCFIPFFTSQQDIRCHQMHALSSTTPPSLIPTNNSAAVVVARDQLSQPWDDLPLPNNLQFKSIIAIEFQFPPLTWKQCFASSSLSSIFQTNVDVGHDGNSSRRSNNVAAKHTAGMFVYICCPTLSPWQYHPFSISSIDPDHYTFTIHVKALGPWTEALVNLIQKQGQKTPTPHHKALLGPTTSTIRGTSKSMTVIMSSNIAGSTGDTDSWISATTIGNDSTRTIITSSTRSTSTNNDDTCDDVDAMQYDTGSVQQHSCHLVNDTVDGVDLVLDGPYGSNLLAAIEPFSHCLFLAGGVGITGISETLYQRHCRHQSSVLVWLVRSYDEMTLLAHDLLWDRLEPWSDSSHNTKIRIFITQGETYQDDTVLSHPLQPNNQRSGTTLLDDMIVTERGAHPSRVILETTLHATGHMATPGRMITLLCSLLSVAASFLLARLMCCNRSYREEGDTGEYLNTCSLQWFPSHSITTTCMASCDDTNNAVPNSASKYPCCTVEICYYCFRGLPIVLTFLLSPALTFLLQVGIRRWYGCCLMGSRCAPWQSTRRWGRYQFQDTYDTELATSTVPSQKPTCCCGNTTSESSDPQQRVLGTEEQENPRVFPDTSRASTQSTDAYLPRMGWTGSNWSIQFQRPILADVLESFCYECRQTDSVPAEILEASGSNDDSLMRVSQAAVMACGSPAFQKSIVDAVKFHNGKPFTNIYHPQDIARSNVHLTLWMV